MAFNFNFLKIPNFLPNIPKRLHCRQRGFGIPQSDILRSVKAQKSFHGFLGNVRHEGRLAQKCHQTTDQFRRRIVRFVYVRVQILVSTTHLKT